jgi:hypothetical protein
MSKKLISRDTIRNWETITGRDWIVVERDGGVEFTQETLERFYHETGVELEGSCEIRQAWTKSQITPRTYFSQGGTAFKLSKYVQEIAGNLVEQLPCTDPITRLNPARIRLRDSNSYLRIYDLSGFTSNHWECKHFVDRLAQFCHGTEVTIVDARRGPLLVDLGMLLSVYNQLNHRASYSMERIDASFEGVTEYHNRAGFLGVFGNINFSTSCHGCSLLMVNESVDSVNVAGDDGHYDELDGMEDIADRVIAGNGVTEKTKEFRSDQIGAVCLKRGVVQVDDRCLPKQMLVFPSFSNIGALFGYTTPQFGDSRMTRQEKKDMVGAEILRFLRGVHLSGISEDLDVALDILRALYEAAHFPKAGSLPPYDTVLIPVLPENPDEILAISPLDSLLRNHFNGGAVLPRSYKSGDMDESEDPIFVSGGEWTGTMTKYLKYLKVLGYVTSDQETEVVWGLDAYERLRLLYSGDLRGIYKFTCIADVPPHLIF